MNINNSNEYMTINNLKELVKIYKNYVNDTHKINIDDSNINLKKIIFSLMEKINSTKYANTLKIEDLNKITLKNLRDYIDENYKHIFPSKDQFATIHRESQVHTNKNRVEVDLRDKIIHNNKQTQNKEINNNFKKSQSIRDFEITKREKVKKNIDFSEKNETILTKNDFNDRMNQLQNERDEFMRKSKKKTNNDSIPEMQPNVEIDINTDQDNDDPNNLLMNKIDETQITNNLETTNMDELNGFDFSAFDDENMDSFATFDNIEQTESPPQDQMQLPQDQMQLPQQDQMQPIQQDQMQLPQQDQMQPLQQDQMQLPQDQMQLPQDQMKSQQPQYINRQKLIINSIDRDTLLYPESNKYVIEFKKPIQNIIKIRLVNVLINLNKIKDKQNYAILKLNNFNNVISNNKNIMNTFAILYSNKIYDDEIEFFEPLESLNKLEIELTNDNGDLYEFTKNKEHIFEFIIEYI